MSFCLVVETPSYCSLWFAKTLGIYFIDPVAVVQKRIYKFLDKVNVFILSVSYMHYRTIIAESLYMSAACPSNIHWSDDGLERDLYIQTTTVTVLAMDGRRRWLDIRKLVSIYYLDIDMKLSWGYFHTYFHSRFFKFHLNPLLPRSSFMVVIMKGFWKLVSLLCACTTLIEIEVVCAINLSFLYEFRGKIWSIGLTMLLKLDELVFTLISSFFFFSCSYHL